MRRLLNLQRWFRTSLNGFGWAFDSLAGISRWERLCEDSEEEFYCCINSHRNVISVTGVPWIIEKKDD